MPKLSNRVTANPFFATLGVLVWAWLFWIVFFQGIAWGLLRVPMGLGGAIYPLLFTIPVAVVTLLYELAVDVGAEEEIRDIVLTRLALPSTIATLLLIAFCPMDSSEWFPAAFVRRLMEAI